MAHFACLNENNVVTKVIVVSNADTVDENGVEREEIGAAYCERLFGGTWKQTSYSGSMRKNYAGVGFTYDASLDAFVPPPPYESWVLNEQTARWEAPVPMPDGDGDCHCYEWDETTRSWYVPAE